ncbi:MAG: hypothetical protein FWD71_06550 [Oscillospiraceae bacterium]|nr:hypothetical protein [Oscillospiraceae bacterium]
MNLKDFLKKYYPVKKLCDSKDYYNKTKEEWQKIFISEYRKYKPHSAEEYNELRSKGIPSWQTVARLFGIKKWMNWIEFCDLERYAIYNYKPKERPVINVSSKVDLLNK